MKIFLLALVAFIFSSCEKIIYVYPGEEKIPTSGLIAEYKFEQPTESTQFLLTFKEEGEFEYFDNGYRIASTSVLVTPVYTFSPGKIGNCIYLDKYAELISYDPKFQSYFDNINKYTISMWIKTTKNGILFACDGQNTFPYKRLNITLQPDGCIAFERYNAATMGDGSYGFDSKVKSLNDDLWHMIVAIYDGKTLSIVVDNNIKESFSAFKNGIMGSETSVGEGQTLRVTIGGNAQNNVDNYVGNIDRTIK